jgi:uncharacterized lipoprotein YmbA
MACALPLLAIGCSSPQPNLYTLAPRPGTPIDRPLPSVALQSVGVAKYLDRPQIVRHRSAYELAVSDAARWGEAMDEMVPRVLVDDLAQRLPATPIATASSGMVPEAKRILTVDIDRFDADPDGTVVLEARWSLRSGARDGKMQTTRIAVPAGSTQTADLVAAMSTCLAQLSDRFVEALAGE